MENTDNNHKLTECPICFIESVLITLPCNPHHQICIECLVKLKSELYLMRNCPFCRQHLPKDFIPSGYTEDVLNKLQRTIDYKPHTIEELNLSSPYELIFITDDSVQPNSSTRITWINNAHQEQLLDNLVYNFRGMNRQRHHRSRSYREHQQHRPYFNSFRGKYRRSLRRKTQRPKKSKKKRSQLADFHRKKRKQFNKSRAPQANPTKYRFRHHNLSRYHNHKQKRKQNRISKT